MRLLHLHSSFAAGGKELRAARLMNAFGTGVRHQVVSSQPDAYGASVALDPALDVNYAADFPSLQGRPSPLRLLAIAKAMRGFDLILTYNWGAMDAVLAHRLYRRLLGLAPLVHHEDGFNEDEANGLKASRNLFRRVALGGAAALVVPSRRLEEIALTAWRQRRSRVHLIINGIATAAYRDPPSADALPGLFKEEGEKWVGTLAGLRPVKDLPRLVRAFATLPPEWRLVIVGEGPEREAIAAQAETSGVADRVYLPGFVKDPSGVVGLFDIFALSSRSEQFPISVVEAMAAGIPVASPAVGDVAGMVAVDNRPFVTPPEDEAALAASLADLAGDEPRRRAIGGANRALAAAQYDETAMVSAYRRTYAEALGRADFP